MSAHDSMELNWHKASNSETESTCVEVAELPQGGRAVRDSKDKGGPVLTFNAAEWASFTAGVRGGEFD